LARVDDLVEQVSDVGLRERLAAAVGDLRRRHRFGLVFEEHIPETTLLAGVPVSVGQVVHYRRDANNLLWRVVSIRGSLAEIEPTENRKGIDARAVPISDLLTIKRFGDPVYPSLLPLGGTRRSDTKPTHVVIDGENYHALQLLLYLHEGEVDCIYIDPPYNTGARDWKYNNRFVDAKDEWRHSKWLSMMDRRLRLAKRLLRPDGVLIVTISGAQDPKQRLLAAVNQIAPVRNEIAHVREIDPDRLLRASVACADVLDTLKGSQVRKDATNG
jgi:adenine-specific DNA-methyltransferase